MNRSLPLLLAVVVTACSGGDDPAPPPEVVDRQVEETPAPPAEPEFMFRFGDSSKVAFVSTKNEGVEVPGSFLGITGGLNLTDGDISTMTGDFSVALERVDTAEPARDLNIRQAVFGLAADASGEARVTVTRVQPGTNVLEVGGETDAQADLDLTLLGTTTSHTAKIKVGRTSTGYTVTSLQPVELSTEALGLGDGRAALKERCGHTQLGDGVTVSVELAVE